jgi:hypothetical protein
MSSERTDEAIAKVCAPIVASTADEPDVLCVVLEPPPLPGPCAAFAGGL